MQGILRRHANSVAIAFIIVSTLIVYLPIRDHDFVNYDDPLFVTGNEVVKQGWTVDGLVWALTTTHGGSWNPVTWFSHMLDCQLFGVAPGPHHLVSLALHIASAVLLFLVLASASDRPAPSAFVASLFALHPLHVESVAWIAERKDVLSTLFWMLTMWSWVRYVRSPRLARYAPVLVFFVSGLLSKPMLVTLPFVLLLLDFWPLARIGDAGVASVWRLVREKLPLFFLAGLFSGITFVAQRSRGAVISVTGLPLPERLANVVVSYTAYIVDTFWPSGLAIFYPYDESLSSGRVAAAALALAIVTVLAIRFARRLPSLAVGWLWYAGTLLPVIGLVQVGNQARADRYTYVPLIGLFIALAFGLPALLRNRRFGHLALTITGSLALAGCLAATSAQLAHWKNSETLYRHTLAVTENNSRAHYNLGTFLAGTGRHEEAVAQYREAVRVQPNLADAHFNLGNALLRLERYDEAIEAYRNALRLSPGDPQAHRMLGTAFGLSNRIDEAIGHYEEVLRIAPRDVEIHDEMARLLAGSGRLDEAADRYRRSLEIDPGRVETRTNLAGTLRRLGRMDEAAAEYSRVLETSPDSLVSLTTLAWILATHEGDPERAVLLAERAASLTGRRDAMTLYVLALAYSAAGREREATEAARRAGTLAAAAGRKDVAAMATEILRRYESGEPGGTPPADSSRR